MKLALERTLVGLLLVVAAGIVVHAPIIVWLGTMWPHTAQYIKAWKEILTGVALLLLLLNAAQRENDWHITGG